MERTDTGIVIDTGNATDTGSTMDTGNTEQIQCIDKDHSEYPQKMRQYPSMPSRIYLKVQPLWKDSGIPLCKSAQRSRSTDHQRDGTGN